jgi:hypothetical protein
LTSSVLREAGYLKGLTGVMNPKFYLAAKDEYAQTYSIIMEDGKFPLMSFH